MARRRWGSTALILALGVGGCQRDQSFSGWDIRTVAVTAGDFDFVAEPFNRLLVSYDIYEGIISTATWSDTYNHEAAALKVELLLGQFDELITHDAVFLASGTRGFGKRVYNGVDKDDQLVNDPVVVENIREYVRRGGVLVCTDWTYDLIEAAWPEAIDFVGDDEKLDAAQTGFIGTVSARVEEPGLASGLDLDTIALDYNFSNWALMEAVEEDTRVWLRGDVGYRASDDAPDSALTDVPLLVSFTPENASGKVVLMTFHIDAQNDVVMDQILQTVVGNFEEGQSLTDDEDEESEDTGEGT